MKRLRIGWINVQKSLTCFDTEAVVNLGHVYGVFN